MSSLNDTDYDAADTLLEKIVIAPFHPLWKYSNDDVNGYSWEVKQACPTTQHDTLLYQNYRNCSMVH